VADPRQRGGLAGRDRPGPAAGAERPAGPLGGPGRPRPRRDRPAGCVRRA
jgi:hypothetical protein